MVSTKALLLKQYYRRQGIVFELLFNAFCQGQIIAAMQCGIWPRNSQILISNLPWIFRWIFSSCFFSKEKGTKKSTKKSPAKFTREFVQINSPRISAEAFS